MALPRYRILLMTAVLASCASAQKKTEDENVPILSIRGVEVERKAYDTSVCMEAINAGTNQAVQFWGSSEPNHRQKKVMDLFATEYPKLIKDADEGPGTSEERTKTYAHEDRKLMQLLKLYAPKLANGCLNYLGPKIKKCMQTKRKKKPSKPEQRECVKAAVVETTQKYLRGTEIELRALK
ncbi:MAG: hypothetical protein JST80_02485 [Bdellovibrionales bacterium]|nr:hypothetical protein [Bdellovibrionales bacterium]